MLFAGLKINLHRRRRHTFKRTIRAFEASKVKKGKNVAAYVFWCPFDSLSSASRQIMCPHGKHIGGLSAVLWILSTGHVNTE